MKTTIIAALSMLLILAGCKKQDFDKTVNGEALGSFQLSGPASSTSLILNSATPNQQIVINWTAARPGLYTEPLYKWVAALKTGDINAPIIEIPANNSGKATSLTLTYKQIDDALAAKGITQGALAELIWSVTADNGTTKIQSNDVFIINITRFSDGASPFVLLGPASSPTSVEINPGSTTDSLRFNWTKSNPGNTAVGVKYKVWFYTDDLLGNPVFSFESNNAGKDTTGGISYKNFSDSLVKYGYANLSDAAKLKWKVSAMSGTWTQWSDYTNEIVILREVKMFLVGGSTEANWEPSQAIQMIQDNGRSGVYYIYTKLTASGGGLKFLNEATAWGSPTLVDYGDADGSGLSGNLQSSGESNIQVPDGDGVYRITVSLSDSKFYVQKSFGRMGFVGEGTAAGWTPSAVFPSQEMGFTATNLFVGIVDITQGKEYKMLDNSDWPNGQVNYTRDYEDLGNGKFTENAAGSTNFKWSEATGPVRFIWDYRDVKNPVYVANNANEMRLVGDGMQGVNAWDPGASPQMTYLGKGKWSLTIGLIGGKEIKFLAGNAWGAFDYEDNSGQSSATGSARKIKWDGDKNFKTPPTDGTYTVVLDEYAQTVTITQ